MEAAHHHRSAATQRVDGDHDQSNKELSNKPEQPLQQRQGQHVGEQQHVPTQDCQLKQYNQPQCAMKSQRLSAKSNCNLGILQSNVGWIDDGIINSAQQMLKQRFPEKNGLQDTLLSQQLQFVVARQNSVQIHNIGNHWVTTSSDEQGSIHLYDSLVRYKLSSHLEQQIASIYRSNEKEITVSIRAVQQQRGGNDCGLFAIAFAYDVASGIDPEYVTYIQSDMRKHLFSCVKKGYLTPFPRYFRGRRDITRCKHSVASFAIYCVCICRQPDSFGRLMIQCNRCDEWFHCKCVCLKPSGRTFYCPRCSSEQGC